MSDDDFGLSETVDEQKFLQALSGSLCVGEGELCLGKKCCNNGVRLACYRNYCVRQEQLPY